MHMVYTPANGHINTQTLSTFFLGRPFLRERLSIFSSLLQSHPIVLYVYTFLSCITPILSCVNPFKVN